MQTYPNIFSTHTKKHIKHFYQIYLWNFPNNDLEDFQVEFVSAAST